MAKILVTEDERDIRDLITFTLQIAGHEVLSAANGEEGLALALQHRPELILSDVRMPRMTGYEMCKQIKANPDTADIPVVFLSAKGQEAEVQAGYEAGAAEYMLKPFAPDQLLMKVAEILNRPKPAPAAGAPPGANAPPAAAPPTAAPPAAPTPANGPTA